MNITSIFIRVYIYLFIYIGNVPAIPRLGLPAQNLEDGPQGVADHVTNVTGWPSTLTVTSAWNISAMREFGAALGAEQRNKGTNVMLGPGVCLARVPMGGRNMEYMGEDPHLAYHMAGAMVRGVQSEGVVACTKHYVDNAQEGPGHNGRLSVSENVGERAQHELYLQPFAGAVDAGTGAIMCSYNLINGTYACENAHTLGLLKNGSGASTVGSGLGFEGWVMSDWGGTHSTVSSALAGLDQEMSGSDYFGAALGNAISQGQVPQARLDDMVRRILTALFRVGAMDRKDYGNLTSNVRSHEHDALARNLAAESTVLLRNENGALPLNIAALKGHSIAVIGDENTVAGSGSGGVVGYTVKTPSHALTARLRGTGVTLLNATYWSPVCGCNQCEQQTPTVTPKQIELAQVVARNATVALVSVVTSSGEGYDRDSLGLGDTQEQLINAVAAVCAQTIVVVRSPGAVTMPWLNSTAAVVLQLLPGQEVGSALVDVLFGDNPLAPSGRLPLSFLQSDDPEDSWLASPAQYPGIATNSSSGPPSWNATYNEGLLIGYRWFDAKARNPLFAFGYGLTYTTFKYSNLKTSGATSIVDTTSLHVSSNSTSSANSTTVVEFTITNTGNRAGAEVAQLYLSFPAEAGEPPYVLRGFAKRLLGIGESAIITLLLNEQDFSVWDTLASDWRVWPGNFGVAVGGSSRDLRLYSTLEVKA